MEDYSRILAEFTSEFDRRDIPNEVIERTRQSILNGTAAAISACHAEPVETIIRVINLTGRGGDARLFGRSDTLDLLNAVLVNAYMAHYNDYDDTHHGTSYHTNPSNVPALLGLGADRHSTGEDAVTALALGFEASIRLGLGLGRIHYAVGWHNTGTLGTVGTALTCSRLLGLDPTRTNHALGLSLTQAAGLRGLMFGTMAKGFNASKAGYNGLLAALLAEQSFTAAPNAIEGGRGYANAASHREGVVYLDLIRQELDPRRAADLTRITDGLGTRWETQDIGFKPYASGAATHATIDAVLAFRNELGLNEESDAAQVAAALGDIASLNITIPAQSLNLPRQRDIETPLEAKFSMYNVAAMVLVRGRAGPGEYNDAMLTDPLIDQVRQLVELTGDPLVEGGAGALDADLRNGRHIEIRIDHALGTYQRPLDDGALRKKLSDATEGVFDRDRTTALADALERINDCEDLSTIMALASA